MEIFENVNNLQKFVASKKEIGSNIGFVPTMGALHEGHLSLIRKSLSECDHTIVSIFVNPTQFNDPSDLKKYPRTIDRDIEQLKKVGHTVVFLPSVEQVYPNGPQLIKKFDLNGLDLILEGSFRPGHFQGVAQVVKRLLEIVQPHRLFLGQKDFQQVLVIKKMIETEGLKTIVRMCPIEREEDGLAMSSRNVRLTPEFRQKAPVIYQTLKWLSENIHSQNLQKLKQHCLETITKQNLKPEYFEIINGNNLEIVTNSDNTSYIVACTAVWAGDVRLIDNIIIE